MGTGFKGGTQYYRSLGQNVMLASQSYKFSNGYFGDASPSTGLKTRNISSSDNLQTAKDFYDKIALGGEEVNINGGRLKISTMADGTIVTMRNFSHSDGTPAVEINIKNSNHTSGVKNQKIHFIMEDKK